MKRIILALHNILKGIAGLKSTRRQGEVVSA
jgi:hypothetical protein